MQLGSENCKNGNIALWFGQDLGNEQNVRRSKVLGESGSLAVWTGILGEGAASGACIQLFLDSESVL